MVNNLDQSSLTELTELRKKYLDDIKTYEALSRLFSNTDFQNIVLQKYCKDFCIEHAYLLTDPNGDINKYNNNLLKVKAPAILFNFFENIKKNYKIAVNNIESVNLSINTLED